MINRDMADRVDTLAGAREPFVLATVVRAARPTSVRLGDTAIVLGDGTIEGFVGGSCARASVRLHAAKVLETGEALLLRLVPGATDADAREGEVGVVVDHNPCLSGGAMEIFLEPQLPAPRILVLGDTPIALALEAVGRAAGYDLCRGRAGDLDPRPDDAAVVVASHGEDEEALLATALDAGVPYVGLVASRKRGAAIRAALDVPDALRSALHTPAGLDIGARRPQEIAIAILAEIVAEISQGARPPVGSGISQGARPPVGAAATAIDPICGMEVAVSPASVHVGDVYFCCEGCRQKYEAARAG